MVERIRHVFKCQACGSTNTCDLREEIHDLGVTCAGCSGVGEPVKGEWELVERESVTLDRNFGPVGEAARQAIEDLQRGGSA